MHRYFSFSPVALCVLTSLALAQEAAPQLERFDPAGIEGTLVLCEESLSEETRNLLLAMAGKDARLELAPALNGHAGNGDGLSAALDLLPGALVFCGVMQCDGKTQVESELKRHPGRFAVVLDEGAALVTEGRRLRAAGEGTVTIYLPPSAVRETKELVLRPGTTADLTALRRAARDRAAAPFPPAELAMPRVEHGALLIVGGGKLTKEMIDRFLELAGGLDAPLVVVPTADEPAPNEEKATAFLRRAGAKDVQVFDVRPQGETASPEQLDVLRRAKGVWFGGGRQWRLVDAYEGTPVAELFHDVLRRGGVIGGSSAGASIQAEYLVRGNPLGNAEMMAEGYERGFGFLPGTAVDQHFTQRNRFGDMESLVRTFPQLLGIGIDESTALVVQGAVAEVIGLNEVRFYGAGEEDGKLDPAVVKAGRRYNLEERAAVE